MAWRSAANIVTKTFGLPHILSVSVRSSSALTARDVLNKIDAPEITALSNGFRVVTENNNRPTATVGVWIDAGSRHENEKHNGVAHFLEHMIYKGTAKRSQKQIESDLEKIGAKLDSYTSREHTSYYVQCTSSDVEKAVELLADLLRNSRIDDASLEQERSLILRQLDQAENYPQAVVLDYLHDAAFQGTPMAKSAMGTSESISKLTRSELRQFLENSYNPGRMTLCGVGGVEHKQLKELAEKYFGDLSARSSDEWSVFERGIRFTGSEFLYRNDQIPLMYGALAVEGVGMKDPDAIPLKVASAMIGSWDCTQIATTNSPTAVTQKISTGYGFHQMKSFSLNYRDCGLFGFTVIMDADSVDDTTSGMKEVIRGWKHLAFSVSDDEVERGKNMYKTMVFTALESNTTRADDVAKQVLCSKDVMSLSDLCRVIDSIDKKDITEAMNRHVYDRDLAVAGVGKTEAWPDYYQMRIGMSFWRL